ncbi:MAG: hypothetical protein ABIP94_24950, partial [Planctomycetota bacterium]
MAHLFHALISILLMAGLNVQASSQSPTTTLQVEGAEPTLANFLERCTGPLRAQPPLPADHNMAIAYVVLGQLRLGDFATARSSLNQVFEIAREQVRAGPSFAGNVAWLCIAHYWYLRATHDLPTVLDHIEALGATALANTADLVASDAYVDEALRVHSIFCVGGMLDWMDRMQSPR